MQIVIEIDLIDAKIFRFAEEQKDLWTLNSKDRCRDMKSPVATSWHIEGVVISQPWDGLPHQRLKMSRQET